MTVKSLLDEAKKLSLKERLVLLEALQENLFSENTSKWELTAKQIAELERSYQKYLENPENTSDWERVRLRIETKLRSTS